MAENYVIDEARQQKAREYSRKARNWSLAGTGLSFVLLLGFAISGLSVSLRDWAMALSDNLFMVVFAYAAVFGLGFGVVTFPLTFYRGYALPKRYGLVIQSLGGWLVDRLKAAALSAVVGLLAVEVLYYLLREFPDWWWLLAAVLAIVFTVIMADLGPIFIAPLLEKYTPLTEGDLKSRLQSLAAKVGARVTGVYTVHMGEKSTRGNAMVTGIGRGKRMVLVDTLFGRYSNNEIEVIMAHELGHQVHHDVWKSVLLSAATTVVTFWVSSLILPAAGGIIGYQGIGDVANMPVLALVFSVLSFLLMPIENWYSRRIETQADDFALDVTSNPAGFRSMMAKLTDQNLGELNPPAWVKYLFYSHPPSADRIERAAAYGRRHPTSS